MILPIYLFLLAPVYPDPLGIRHSLSGCIIRRLLDPCYFWEFPDFSFANRILPERPLNLAKQKESYVFLLRGLGVFTPHRITDRNVEKMHWTTTVSPLVCFAVYIKSKQFLIVQSVETRRSIGYDFCNAPLIDENQEVPRRRRRDGLIGRTSMFDDGIAACGCLGIFMTRKY